MKSCIQEKPPFYNDQCVLGLLRCSPEQLPTNARRIATETMEKVQQGYRTHQNLESLFERLACCRSLILATVKKPFSIKDLAMSVLSSQNGTHKSMQQRFVEDFCDFCRRRQLRFY